MRVVRKRQFAAGCVRPKQVNAHASSSEAARELQHRLEVEQRLLEDERLALLDASLHDLVADEDRFPVEVLRVKQVFARAVLPVILAHLQAELVLPPRGEVLLHEIGGGVDE